VSLPCNSAWEDVQIDLAARKRYGDGLVPIGPDSFITDAPQIRQKINGVRAGLTKDSWYAVMRLDPYTHSMVSTQDVAIHNS